MQEGGRESDMGEGRGREDEGVLERKEGMERG